MLNITHLCVLGFVLEDFTLKKGEIVTVMGPSGSGKTLLLRAIADLDPNDGSMSLSGVARADMLAPDWRKRVTYLSAIPAWWEARVRGHFEDPVRAVEIFASFELPEEMLERSVDRLSTGEGQRVALARALAGRPEILLLDEPTSSLDEDVEQAVERHILALARSGTGILMVTHDKGQAKRMSKRLLMISKDTITECRP